MFSLYWEPAQDAVSGGAVLYNVYGPEAGDLYPAFVDATNLIGSVACDRYPSPSTFRGTPGIYRVRAIDWAGNEDSNVTMRTLSNACTDPPRADAGLVPDATSAATPDGRPLQTAADASPADGPRSPPADSAIAAAAPGADAASYADAGVAAPDVALPNAMPAPRARGCAVGAHDRDSGALWVVLAGLALTARRRRSPQGRRSA